MKTKIALKINIALTISIIIWLGLTEVGAVKILCWLGLIIEGMILSYIIESMENGN